MGATQHNIHMLVGILPLLASMILAVSGDPSTLDLRSHDRLLAQFHRIALSDAELAWSKHARNAPTPNALLLASTAEYLAAIDKQQFLPVLMARHETWIAPHLFIPAFRHMGPGWIGEALQSCQEDACRNGVAVLIQSATAIENLPELNHLIATEQGNVWRGAVSACERIDDASCWVAMELSAPRRSVVEQLAVRMARWKVHRDALPQLLAAATDVAAAAAQQPPGPERAQMWNELDAFVRLANWTKLDLPRELLDAIHKLGAARPGVARQ